MDPLCPFYISEKMFLYFLLNTENVLFERKKKKVMFSKVYKGNNLNNSRERKGVIR